MANYPKKMKDSNDKMGSALRAVQEALGAHDANDRLSADDQRRLFESLPLPTLNDRLNLYLRAVYGPHEFTNKEYVDAREIILAEMAASVRINPPHGSDEAHPIHAEARYPKREAHLSALAFDAPIQVETGAVVARARVLGNDDRALFSMAPKESRTDTRHPEPIQRSFKRPLAFIAVAAAISAIALIVIVPQTWLDSQPEPPKPSVIAQYPPVLSSPSFPSQQNVVNSQVHFDRGADSELIIRLLRLASQLIATGDLSAARLMLKEAADVGHAPAALALGATFDPFEIKGNAPRDVSPDIAMAKVWYERAAALGSSEAPERLKRLGGLDR